MLNLRPNITYYDDGGYSWVPIFSGEMSPSLVQLQYLEYLDLSNNAFTKIPNFIGAFTNLEYLNFSGNPLTGIIPPELGNLTKLDILDLSSVYHSLSTNSFTWLSRLSNLRILKLNSCFTKAIDWFDSFRTAPSLLNLHLQHDCEFPMLDYDSTFSHTNTNSSTNSITTLEVVSRSSFGSTTVSRLLNLSNNLIDLSLFLNNYDHIIPHTLGSLKYLRHLYLSGLVGEVPKSIGNLCKLQELVLNDNRFNSSTITDILKSLIHCNSNSLEILNLPHNNLTGQFVHIDIARIPNLKELDVSYNKFNGKWPESISKLSSLELLDISGNSFSGVVYETHLDKLSKLEHLDLSYNSLTLKLANNWVPPFQLQHLGLRCCMIGPQFPSWLQTQSNISHIDLSYSGISDTIPTWSFNTISSLRYLNLSFNQIEGTLPNIPLPSNHSPVVDLSSNQFHGHIPLNSLFNANMLNLSNNTLKGFDPLFCNSLLDHGTVEILDLSNNQLFGNLPDCWFRLQNLIFLNLHNNRLFGVIPNSISSLYQIQILDLGKNNFSGTLPSSMKNCTQLTFLDVGENNLEGTIPLWIGETLTTLYFLQLKSNNFHGSIPSTLCHLQRIIILDMSHNNIHGPIPSCINNFTTMVELSEIFNFINGVFYPIDLSAILSYSINTLVTWKGKEYTFQEYLGLLRIIDLSSNRLIGDIPMELTNLVELVQLNLSRNNLSGCIPENIGNLSKLEALDFSHNNFTGKIPIGLGEVSFLQYLDLSYNHLSGSIPTGTQLQSFDASSYVGNDKLCGLPLLIKCPGDHNPILKEDDPHDSNFDDQRWFDMSWFYVGLEVGIALGFIGVCGALYRNSFLLDACFLGCFNQFGDWLYVVINIRISKLKTYLQS